MGAVSKVCQVKMQIRLIQMFSFYLKTGLFWDLFEIFFVVSCDENVQIVSCYFMHHRAQIKTGN